MVLALPGVASAQWYPGNNAPYYGGGQQRDLRPVARNLKDRSRDFERQVDRAMNNRRYNRNNYSGNIKRLASDFRKAADHFQSKYGNGRNLNNSADAARRLLDAASRLDNAIQNSGMNNQLMRQWAPMRRDLNLVANTYGYRYNNQNRNNRNADWRNRVPFPLPF